ncbi:hypothetical protein [Hyphococcus sp.]|uniref:hypothetical protein n=1 Tax=Hyphococcus sp. TaxID=2038636 RepID=UPI0035C6D3A3
MKHEIKTISLFHPEDKKISGLLEQTRRIRDVLIESQSFDINNDQRGTQEKIATLESTHEYLKTAYCKAAEYEAEIILQQNSWLISTEVPNASEQKRFANISTDLRIVMAVLRVLQEDLFTAMDAHSASRECTALRPNKTEVRM